MVQKIHEVSYLLLVCKSIPNQLIAFSKIADKKIYEETIRRFGASVVSGRSKRVYCGMVLQRPDTSFVEGAIRDNLGCRICMGQMSDTAYKMTFGSDFSDVRNNRREIHQISETQD